MNHIQNEVNEQLTQAGYSLNRYETESDSEPTSYNWMPLIEFLSGEYPPYAVADSLITGYFQLTEYLIMDEDNTGRQDLWESMSVLKRLFQVIQKMERETEQEEEEGTAPSTLWGELIQTFIQECSNSDRLHTSHFPQWLRKTLAQKEEIIRRQNEEIGVLNAHLETLHHELAQMPQSGKKTKLVN